jgi:hypothetical protein
MDGIIFQKFNLTEHYGDFSTQKLSKAFLIAKIAG